MRITPKNCIEYYNEVSVNNITIVQQAKAWKIVFYFCKQNGMDIHKNSKSGIENVISFIDKKIKDSKKLKKLLNNKNYGKGKVN